MTTYKNDWVPKITNIRMLNGELVGDIEDLDNFGKMMTVPLEYSEEAIVKISDGLEFFSRSHVAVRAQYKFKKYDVCEVETLSRENFDKIVGGKNDNI